MESGGLSRHSRPNRQHDGAASFALTALPIGRGGDRRLASELVEEGYVLRERQGRRNRYQVKPELPLRHPLVQEREVGELLEVLSEGWASR
jgi:hypothetical protein